MPTSSFPSPSVWRGPSPLVLASTSSTRRMLLESAGLVVEARAPGVDERAVEADCTGQDPKSSPEGLALRLAEAKAFAVAQTCPDRVVVGADQVLDADGRVFHKPTSLEEARAQIGELAGRTHALHSAVAIVQGGRVESFVETARLTLRPLDPDAIAAYVALAGADRVRASVGGYQLEGLGIHLFDRVEGDHSTILGLPLLPLLARLRASGLLTF
ncbi:MULTISPECIES: Maf family nucleotide pyrophosphatase [Methylobacterium]|nr:MULTISPECIES: Maf family nucleotide pyrophosphatase [Methylobacterium]TXN81221.1 septum formation protein Maf [Methylobacterium sp. WL8]